MEDAVRNWDVWQLLVLARLHSVASLEPSGGGVGGADLYKSVTFREEKAEEQSVEEPVRV